MPFGNTYVMMKQFILQQKPLYRTSNCPDCRSNLRVIERDNYTVGIFAHLSKTFGTIGIKLF